MPRGESAGSVIIGRVFAVQQLKAGTHIGAEIWHPDIASVTVKQAGKAAILTIVDIESVKLHPARKVVIDDVSMCCRNVHTERIAVGGACGTDILPFKGAGNIGLGGEEPAGRTSEVPDH